MNVHFYLLQDRETQNQFNRCWKTGKENLSDYFTKHFLESHHVSQQPTYLCVPKRLINAVVLSNVWKKGLINICPMTCKGVTNIYARPGTSKTHYGLKQDHVLENIRHKRACALRIMSFGTQYNARHSNKGQ